MRIVIDGRAPVVAGDAWTAPNVTLIGDVTLESRASVWYGSVLRADNDSISVGEGSNVQDNCTLHVDPGFPLRIGRGVSVGHGVVLHGCTIDDDVLVGMNSVILNGAHVSRGTLIAAGSVVLEGTDVPPNSLVAGVPARARRELRPDELDRIAANARTYERLSAEHASAEAT